MLKTKPRAKQPRVKEEIVVGREFKNIKLNSEDVAEFEHQPMSCRRSYRVVVVRKNLSVMKGEDGLFDDVKYLFYITNERALSREDVVREANERCDQENLIEQLKILPSLSKDTQHGEPDRLVRRDRSDERRV